MSASISLQKDVSVAYLGSPCSFSHQAARERFGDSIAFIPHKRIHGKRMFIILEWVSEWSARFS